MLSNNPTLNIPSPQAGVTARYLQLLAAAERLPDPATDTTGLQRALLDALDVGLVTTHANGELLHANRAALRWCDACAPLSLSDGRLRANQPDDQQKLMQALTQARLGHRPAVHAVRAADAPWRRHQRRPERSLNPWCPVFFSREHPDQS